MNVEFSTLEYNYVARVASKLMLARKNLSARDMSRGTNQIIKEIANKFSVNVEPAVTHTVPLKRTHLRFLQEALAQSILTIETKIIPEYNSRPNKDELGDYIQRLNDTRAMLKDMLDKVEASI